MSELTREWLDEVMNSLDALKAELTENDTYLEVLLAELINRVVEQAKEVVRDAGYSALIHSHSWIGPVWCCAICGSCESKPCGFGNCVSHESNSDEERECPRNHDEPLYRQLGSGGFLEMPIDFCPACGAQLDDNAPLRVSERPSTPDTKDEIIVKARGLVRTADVPEYGDIRVVRQWWDGLVKLLDELGEK